MVQTVNSIQARMYNHQIFEVLKELNSSYEYLDVLHHSNMLAG